MKKSFFITSVTIITTIIPLATVAFFFTTTPITFCGRPQHSPDTPVLLIVGLITSAIVTFPLVWLAGWVSSLLDHLWLIPVGVLANGILWGQILWFLKQRNVHARQAEKERNKIL